MRLTESDHEITNWLARAREDDEDAFRKLFDYYIGRLRLYLRNKLTKQDRAEGFEDDLANETMDSILHSAISKTWILPNPQQSRMDHILCMHIRQSKG